MFGKRKKKPELVQFGDLSADHFARHPVWIGVHGVDDEEPWYDDTDEETFRPWDGGLPADPESGMLLVRAEMTLADGTGLPGFVTPDPGTPGQAGHLGTVQPHLVAPDGRLHGFWTGGLRSSAEHRAGVYASLRRRPEAVFPLRFRADATLVRGGVEGRIDGFLSSEELGGTPVVDR